MICDAFPLHTMSYQDDAPNPATCVRLLDDPASCFK